MLSVESKRAVFERRPMQFPTQQSWACEINTKSVTRKVRWEHHIGSRWKAVCVTFVCIHFHLAWHAVVERSVLSFLLVSSWPTCRILKTSAFSTSFCGSRDNPCASARWSGMFGRKATRPKTQVMSPTFTVTWARSTRRSISLTVSRAVTTPPSSQLRNIQKSLIWDHAAAASKPQVA